MQMNIMITLWTVIGKHGIMMFGQFKNRLLIAEKLGLPLVCVDSFIMMI